MGKEAGAHVVADTLDGDHGPWPNSYSTAKLRSTKIQKAKVLVVGAGGIGCELLKTLALSGFKNIHVIDLDTIDVSNLNRQFLFRKCHVGQSKANVAAQAVKRFAPDVKIVADMADVTQAAYDLEFFRKFDIVLNGLDNLEARRHVNKMCLSARVPLVESGTAGYLGQVTVHVGSKVECFDCQAKPRQKSYAVCTIRRTPQKPIHCVVWAKEVAFHGLFGEGETEDLGENVEFDKGMDAGEYARWIFTKLFSDNINAILKDVEESEEDVWKGRDPPKPLSVEDFQEDFKHVLENQSNHGPSMPSQDDSLDVHQSARMFIQAVLDLVNERADLIGSMTFDKDDDPVMRFVAAASNLRSACYGIPMQSLFQAKGMAGNIIHAIATTNAIVGGLIVVQAMKILAGDGDVSHSRATFVQQYPSSRKLITPVQCMKPNPKCEVCSLIPIELRVDINETTLRDLVDNVIKKEWNMSEFMIDNGSDFLYEEGEYLEPDEVASNAKHLDTCLKQLPGGGISHNSTMTVIDEDSSLKVPVLVCHREGAGFQLHGDIKIAREQAARRDEARKKEEEKEKQEIVLFEEDQDVVEILTSSPPKGGENGVAGERENLKRKRSDNGEDDDVIELS